MKLNKLGMVVIAAIPFLYSCSSSNLPHPTKQSPIPGCHITCKYGYPYYKKQHLCNGGGRYFEDITIIGEDNVPGDPSSSRWYAIGGAYKKEDVELGTCRSVILGIIQERQKSERGQYPGEDPLGVPNSPPK